MILSDFDLESYIKHKRLIIEPMSKETIRENGLDLRLANEIARHNPKLNKEFVLDPSNVAHVKKEYIIEKNDEELIIPAKTQVLASTIEQVGLPDNLMGFVELRSTWARHGLILPPTIIDAGFAGTVTLEVYNSSEHAILLRPGTRFAHVIFATTLNRVKNAYKGSYLRQKGIRVPKVIKKKE